MQETGQLKSSWDPWKGQVRHIPLLVTLFSDDCFVVDVVYSCMHLRMYACMYSHHTLTCVIAVLAGKLAAEVVAKRATQATTGTATSETTKGIKAVHGSVLERASKYTAKDPVGVNVNGDPAIAYGGGAIVNTVSETIRELGEIIRPSPEDASVKL